MARKASGASKSGNSKKAPPAGGAAGLELSDDQRYALTAQHKNKYLVLIEAQKTANNALKNFGKIVKADLGPNGLDDIKGLIKLETPEGEAELKADMERQARLMRWMNVKIGFQGSLFEGDDPTPLVDRAHAEGKRQGLAGETCSNPHHVSTEAHRAHNAGYGEGQQILAQGFKPIDNAPKGSSPQRNDGGLADQIARGDELTKTVNSKLSARGAGSYEVVN